jgi:hypothetical protein
MLWGNLLESTFRDIMSRLLKTDIVESSSIPSAEVAGKTFSMDGIGIVRFLCDRWNDIPYEYFMYMITLFEFKCPYSRVPVQNEIYKEYIPQVKSGMSDLAIPEIALYCEGVFRVSRFDNLGYNRYIEKWLHKTDQMEKLPMSWGFLGFYMPEPAIPDDPEASVLIDWLKSGEQDFAKLENQNTLRKLIKFVKTDDVKVWHSKMSISNEFKRCDFFRAQKIPIHTKTFDMDNQLLEFYNFCRTKKYMPMGVLSIKLFDINVVPIEKENHYTKKYEKEISSALEKINSLKSINNIVDRQMAYEKMYNIEHEETILDAGINDYI